jgi:DNA-directed RNA polymerase specialized sigma24 family protein
VEAELVATRGREPPNGSSRAGTGGAQSGATARVDEGESDVDLVIRMRTGAPAAFQEFVERFHSVLLNYARRAAVGRTERDELVSDVLSDVALELLAPGARTPRNPRMYLIGAFRHRLLNGQRGHTRRDRHHSGALEDAMLDSEYADDGEMVAGCSEGAVRESRGPGWERVALPKSLERLAMHLDEALTDEERQLLVAVAENVPQREVAAWLRVSHVVARKRLERLRGRMMEVAMRYTNALEPDDAREVQRFFRRCRARIGASEDPATRLTEAQRPSSAAGSDEPNKTETRGNSE